ncbi:MAG: hypothetical protein IZT58_16305, partial [Actinobacteria bacterium]|nr:hypothetical protein [Actinomycetota bacterium]
MRTISEPKPEELGRGPLSYHPEVSSWHTPHWSGAPVSHELQNTSVNQPRDQQGKTSSGGLDKRAADTLQRLAGCDPIAVVRSNDRLKLKFAGGAQAMNGAKTVFVLIALALLTTAGNLDAFERDTHYYLTFALSLSTCFDWDEAHIIASADWMTDNNRTTVAEMNPLKKRNKRGWHAFGHSHERYNELWHRVVSEPDELRRLVKLGQFLHFLQDWEAHARFPVGIGHAAATIGGNDPDSIARSEPRTAHAAQATLDHMALMCSEMDRLPEGYDDPDMALPEMFTLLAEDRLIWELVETSRPNWRARLKGGLTREGRRVMARNIHRIEEYVERRMA